MFWGYNFEKGEKMPIAREVTYKCPKCRYEMIEYQGDVITLSDLIKICPKCGSKMKIIFSSGSVIWKILDIFKRRKKWY